jgi:hypothetical protein
MDSSQDLEGCPRISLPKLPSILERDSPRLGYVADSPCKQKALSATPSTKSELAKLPVKKFFKRLLPAI